MKEKIIGLIKKYRAESQRLWELNTANACGRAAVYEKCTDDLEQLVATQLSDE